MSPPPLHRFGDRETLALALAGEVAARLGEAIERRGRAVLAVSGGSTPALFLRRLADAALDWARVTVTLVDERFVEPSSSRSNMRMVRETLLTGKAAGANLVPLHDGSMKLRQAAAAAARAIAALGRLDACVLGMGADGHTASLFPGGDRLEEAADPACADAVVAIEAPGAGEARLTLTLPVIAAARFLALHIEGEEKRAALERALSGGPPAQMPVRYVIDSAGERLHVFWAP